jgi:hypothetical protein
MRTAVHARYAAPGLSAALVTTDGSSSEQIYCQAAYGGVERGFGRARAWWGANSGRPLPAQTEAEFLADAEVTRADIAARLE